MSHASWLLLQGLVLSVSQQFASMVSELLDMLHKTEQSLARVRRNRPADIAGPADASELSNIQKICLQLYLDVQVKFHRQPCHSHGMQAPSPSDVVSSPTASSSSVSAVYLELGVFIILAKALLFSITAQHVAIHC